MTRPKVLINLAMSVDGKIAWPDGSRLSISSEKDMGRVHGLRDECDAVLVGIGTVLKDDPSLLVKERYVRSPTHPLRVVLDSKGRTPVNARILGKGSRTLIAVTSGREDRLEQHRSRENVEVLPFGEGRVDIEALLGHLHVEGIESILVEGGGEVIWSFVDAGLFDEITIFVGNMLVGGSGPTPASGTGADRTTGVHGLFLEEVREMEGGVLLRYTPSRIETGATVEEGPRDPDPMVD